jgi:hypothetical protein
VGAATGYLAGHAAIAPVTCAHHQLGRSVPWHIRYPASGRSWVAVHLLTVADPSCPLVIASCGPYVAQSGRLLPKPIRQPSHHQAHPDRPPRIVRQRPLAYPRDGARSPSVSHSVCRQPCGPPNRLIRRLLRGRWPFSDRLYRFRCHCPLIYDLAGRTPCYGLSLSVFRRSKSLRKSRTKKS